jgi:ATP-binding cassette subfamily C protein CydC
MVLGTLSGLLAVASAVGLLALSGWFISAATYAGLTAMTVQLFNFFYPGIGVRVFAIGRTLARYVERIVSHDATFRILQSLRSRFYLHLEPLGLSQALMTLISGLAVLATLYLAVILVNRDVLDGPIIALVTLAVLASFEAVFPLPAAYQFLGLTREAGRRLLGIVDSKPEVIFPGQSVTRPRYFGVRFENVCFKYNQNAGWALRDVDFHIHPGRRVAVIGETGSGKSTLIHLLVRFSDPDIGCIQIGGVDVCNFGESDLRRHISVVAQQPHMFNATLRENLLMARPGAGEDELLEALKFAQLLSFVSDLPDGLDTWIGEAAKLLSGGQARRVAVARAILHNGPLWVLDEPTEGLDPVTEGRMMAAIKAQTVDRSLLLITHRLIDLHWMDDIVMLDKGRIVAQGTHEELLIGNSQYASMHRRIP